MARPEKVAVVDRVRQGFEDSHATLLTDYRGLSVAELAQLRGDLRDAGAEYRIAKNTLTRRAAHDAGIEGLDEYLVGPTALAFCGEDPVAPAKALKQFSRTHPELAFKAAILDGEILDAEATARLAELETRDELLSGLAGLLNGALAMVANYAQAVARDVLGLVTALEDAGGPQAKGFGDGETPAEAERPAPSETDGDDES